MSLIREKSTRSELLRNVQATSFAVDEAKLYLDTHPYDKKAQAYFDKYNNARQRAVQAFEELYGPLLVDDIDAVRNGWQWIDPPMPWEE